MTTEKYRENPVPRGNATPSESAGTRSDKSELASLFAGFVRCRRQQPARVVSAVCSSPGPTSGRPVLGPLSLLGLGRGDRGRCGGFWRGWRGGDRRRGARGGLGCGVGGSGWSAAATAAVSGSSGLAAPVGGLGGDRGLEARGLGARGPAPGRPVRRLPQVRVRRGRAGRLGVGWAARPRRTRTWGSRRT